MSGTQQQSQDGGTNSERHERTPSSFSACQGSLKPCDQGAGHPPQELSAASPWKAIQKLVPTKYRIAVAHGPEAGLAGVQASIGTYTIMDTANWNHGAPVFLKSARQGEGNHDVSMYYWESDDQFTGWWLSESVGSVTVLVIAFAKGSKPSPPFTGWQFPHRDAVRHRVTCMAIELSTLEQSTQPPHTAPSIPQAQHGAPQETASRPAEPEEPDDSESHDAVTIESASIAKRKGLKESTATPNDPAYSLSRLAPTKFPQTVKKGGKRADVVYSGDGWWFHFVNPTNPTCHVQEDDFQRVLNHLAKNHSLKCQGVKATKDCWIVTAALGQAKGQGCLQIFPTNVSGVSGNLV